MKDRLEEFIKENRSGFDIHEPAEHLWDKIRKREEEPIFRGHRVRQRFIQAAAVAAVFLLSWMANDYIDYRHDKKTEKQADQVYEAVPELKETEIYYNSLVNEKMDELKPWFSKMPGLSTEVNGDLSELDSVYSSLKQDLRDNIANDQVIEAMIQNYRMKLEILEDLLNELKSEQNSTKNEKKEHSI
jgi:hypothetical protein